MPVTNGMNLLGSELGRRLYWEKRSKWKKLHFIELTEDELKSNEINILNKVRVQKRQNCFYERKF